jgi:membrane-associated phospholipid phosphatase
MLRGTLILLLALALPATSDAEPAQVVAKPELSWRLDGLLVGSGLAAIGFSFALATDDRPVPVDGFPSSDVRLDFDRDAIGKNDANAWTASHVMAGLSLSYPLLLRAAFSEDNERLSSSMNIAVMTLESVVIAQGVGGIVKPLVSRPRPFTYLAESDRPSGAEYDVQRERAFQSFPSDHSSTAWAAVSTGICDHLLSHPTASWSEHAAVGLIGGMLATATAGLRVEAGQHFPTDVAAGSMLGIACGTTVPLLHRYTSGSVKAPLPPRKSLVGALAGTAAGIGLGVLTVEAVGD